MSINPFRGFREIIRVISITPGRHHAWVETIHGTFRKPIGSIPHYLLDEFNGLPKKVTKSSRVELA